MYAALTQRINVSAKSGLVIMCVSPCFTMTCLVPSSNGCARVATYVQFTEPPDRDASSEASNLVPLRLSFTLMSMSLAMMSLHEPVKLATVSRAENRETE